MKDNVTNLGMEKTFPLDAEMTNRLLDVISDYSGEVSVCSVLGALEVVKMTIFTDNFLEFVDQE